MSKEDIDRLIRQQNRQTELLRKYKEGSAVGFGDIEPDPLVIDTVLIEGRPVRIQVPGGYKKIIPQGRILVLRDGSLLPVSGGLGQTITSEDAQKILDQNHRFILTNALKKDLKKRKSKLNG